MHAATTKVGLTAALLLAALGFLARPAVDRAPRYLMVDELVLDDPARWTETLKIHGWVVPGSIAVDKSAQTFVLQKNGHRLRVFFSGPLPDVFRDNAEIVATGRLIAPAALAATDLSARCASRYDGPPVYE